MRVGLACLACLGVLGLTAVSSVAGCRRDDTPPATIARDASAAPQGVRADLSSVYVRFVSRSPTTGVQILVVHNDGVAELIDAEGLVLHRTAPGVAKVDAMKRLFGSERWTALRDGDASMYEVAVAGRTVRRADPLSKVEPAFVEALGLLGEAELYAEKAPRP
jgi:hypothetical protein